MWSSFDFLYEFSSTGFWENIGLKGKNLIKMFMQLNPLLFEQNIDSGAYNTNSLSKN